MNSKQKSEILQTLGYSALLKIEAGNPLVIDLGYVQLVQFWLYGQECEYYFDTEPILLRQVEADKEFTTFDQLIKEICIDSLGNADPKTPVNPGGTHALA